MEHKIKLFVKLQCNVTETFVLTQPFRDPVLYPAKVFISDEALLGDRDSVEDRSYFV